ncbi:Uma2 family endonuclease [Hymenobacter psychrotolerans]|uniref:Endonuclease, Uma2 family (Restriction endonuclease fold) n=1 Tax=Hymenobacter psychrotolerans DSM 18569 TaxID=1121959 RepID=A0A1M7HT37_9BACT|nr:Uma2 family endonuclease [Hymenobacter psychrotolerans]SHM31610.1 Endonuclease, Uma2 family (restriction endonuclease fold) [Hymenobacter psychrotolerans DSM 18569]
MPPITSLSQLDLTKTYTYADYLTWQLTEWVELIRGKVRPMSPAPQSTHQTISFNLSTSIGVALRGKLCRGFAAPFDVRLSKITPNGDASIETVVQPDLCVVCDLSKIDKRGCVGAPDWIIEILSPGNFARDTKEKFDLYEENGVGEYWIVSPGEKSIAVYVLQDGRYHVRGEFYTPGPIPLHTLPEFSIEWTEVFEGA